MRTCPPHETYVEPFGGAASVLLRKPRSHVEVYNELDGEVVNVFRVMRDPEKAVELRRRLRLTPFARKEFEWSYEESVGDDVDWAHRVLVRSYMGFSTDSVTRKHQTGFRTNRTKDKARAGGGRKAPAQEWATFPDAIDDFIVRLQGVVIEQCQAIEVISRYDGENTLFFVDPPYMMSTRGENRTRHGYRHELSDWDHRMLATMLNQVKGLVMLSGYWSHLYEESYGKWRCLNKETYANGAHARTECLWLNFQPDGTRL